MPLLQVTTNQTLDQDQQQLFLARCSQAVADILGKSESYVMVTLKAGAPMLFAGDDGPCVYLELKSIGLPEIHTGEISASLCKLMESELGIGGDRVYIEFADAERHMWGWNGGTF